MTTKTPKQLQAEGRAFYAQMLDEYDISDAGGRALLTRAAECVDRLAEAQARIKKDGAIITNQYGNPATHPAIKLEKEARDGFFTALRLLRLDTEESTVLGRPPNSTKFADWNGAGRDDKN